MSTPAVKFDHAEASTCMECGDQVERGYGLADESEAGFVIRSDQVVCDTCGFNDIGFAGCAPTLSDFGSSADGLILFELEDGSVVSSQVTEES